MLLAGLCFVLTHDDCICASDSNEGQSSPWGEPPAPLRQAAWGGQFPWWRPCLCLYCSPLTNLGDILMRVAAPAQSWSVQGSFGFNTTLFTLITNNTCKTWHKTQNWADGPFFCLQPTFTPTSTSPQPAFHRWVFADGSIYNRPALGHVQLQLFLLGLLVSVKKKTTGGKPPGRREKILRGSAVWLLGPGCGWEEQVFPWLFCFL